MTEVESPASGVSVVSVTKATFTDGIGGDRVHSELKAKATSSRIGVRIQGVVATQAGMGLDNVQLRRTYVAPKTRAFRDRPVAPT